jgi:hypothetical protein
MPSRPVTPRPPYLWAAAGAVAIFGNLLKFRRVEIRFMKAFVLNPVVMMKSKKGKGWHQTGGNSATRAAKRRRHTPRALLTHTLLKTVSDVLDKRGRTLRLPQTEGRPLARKRVAALRSMGIGGARSFTPFHPSWLRARSPRLPGMENPVRDVRACRSKIHLVLRDAPWTCSLRVRKAARRSASFQMTKRCRSEFCGVTAHKISPALRAYRIGNVKAGAPRNAH